MDERASARFVAEMHRQLTAEVFFSVVNYNRVLHSSAAEEQFYLLHIFFSTIKRVINNFLPFLPI